MSRAAALLILLAAGGCNGRTDRHARGSVTVRLPAARPAVSEPGFSFSNSTANAADQGAVERH
ncbi:hypothetical protein [Sphingomonas flavescens]|jgi:hypothetical protein|uniref:hypothetical protein n=1 Tax=Sphingomonas flavescens TaxID=3132797 RepID=UPI002803DE13|nr:hypothetical protein [Sphingomonas limnosediminicola]